MTLPGLMDGATEVSCSAFGDAMIERNNRGPATKPAGRRVFVCALRAKRAGHCAFHGLLASRLDVGVFVLPSGLGRRQS